MLLSTEYGRAKFMVPIVCIQQPCLALLHVTILLDIVGDACIPTDYYSLHSNSIIAAVVYRVVVLCSTFPSKQREPRVRQSGKGHACSATAVVDGGEAWFVLGSRPSRYWYIRYSSIQRRR